MSAGDLKKELEKEAKKELEKETKKDELPPKSLSDRHIFKGLLKSDAPSNPHISLALVNGVGLSDRAVAAASSGSKESPRPHLSSLKLPKVEKPVPAFGEAFGQQLDALFQRTATACEWDDDEWSHARILIEINTLRNGAYALLSGLGEAYESKLGKPQGTASGMRLLLFSYFNT